jgi:hypothetical protein
VEILKLTQNEKKNLFFIEIQKRLSKISKISKCDKLPKFKLEKEKKNYLSNISS